MSHELLPKQALGIYHTSYDVLVKDLEKTGLTGHELRTEAAKQFRPRHKIDQAFSILEQSGQSDYEGLDFEITPEGDLYYPGYGNGITAEELNERTRLYNPTQYSLIDHQTSRLVARTLARGATVVAVSLFREGVDNRDIQLYHIDPITKRGKSMTFNVGLHSFAEIQDIIQEKFSNLAQCRPHANVSVFTDKPLKQEIAHNSVENTSEKQNVIQSQKRVIKNYVDRKEISQVIPKPVDAHYLEREWVGIRKIVSKLSFISETHVAVGAAPVLVALLAKELPKSVVTVEKSISRHKRKEKKNLEMKERKQERQKRAFQPVLRFNSIRIENQMSMERPRKKLEERIRIKTVSVENKKEPMRIVQKNKGTYLQLLRKTFEFHLPMYGKKETKEAMKLEKENRLVWLLIVLSRNLQKQEKPIFLQKKNVHKEVALREHKRVRRRERKKLEKKAITSFVYAFVLRLVVFEREINKKEHIPHRQLTHNEQGSWILLSIIWYLVMIREQGMKHMHQKKKKKKQYGIVFDRNVSAQIPLHGMIWI